jgi:hypothetical protein
MLFISFHHQGAQMSDVSGKVTCANAAICRRGEIPWQVLANRPLAIGA